MIDLNGLIATKHTGLGLCSIRTATGVDDCWVRHLSKVFSNQIGFIPDAGRLHRIEIGHVKIIELNDAPAGFMMHSLGIRKPAHLAQIAIDEDAWANGIADFAIATLLKQQQTATYTGVTAKVRSDLRLNGVAERMGAERVKTLTPVTARNLPINLWAWPHSKALPTIRTLQGV